MATEYESSTPRPNLVPHPRTNPVDVQRHRFQRKQFAHHFRTWINLGVVFDGGIDQAVGLFVAVGVYVE